MKPKFMKTLLKKMNTKTVASIVVGIVLAVVMNAGASMVAAQNPSTVEPFLGPISGLMSRIGSLAIGSSTVPSWVNDWDECVTADNSPIFQTQTCLDVAGSGVFSNLIVDQNAHVLETATISTAPTYNPGTRSAVGIDPAFWIEAVGGNDGFLIQGLGRTNGPVGEYYPLDTTTQREVCADADGTLAICSG